MRLGEIGSERDGAVITLQRLREAFLARKHIAAIAVGLGEISHQCDGAVAARQRFLKAPELP